MAVYRRMNIGRHTLCLLLVAEGAENPYRVPLFVLRKEVLGQFAAVFLNHAVGRLDNGAGRTVILFEFENLCLGIVFLKPQDVFDARPAERIDALRVVAHHANVAPHVGQFLDNQVLGVVRILILVHQNILELLAVLLDNFGVVAQQDVHVEQQVVKVHGSVLPTLTHVVGIDFGQSGTLGPRIFGHQGVVGSIGLGQHQVVLGQRNTGINLVGFILFVGEFELSDDGFDHIAAVGRVVDGKGLGEAEQCRLGPQDAAEERVKGTHPQSPHHLGRQDTGHTVAHFASRFVGEGQGHDVAGRNALFQHMGDAHGQHARFAGACTGDNQRGAVVVFDRTALRAVESFEIIRFHVNPAAGGRLRRYKLNKIKGGRSGFASGRG